MTRTHRGLGKAAAAIAAKPARTEDQTRTLKGIGHIRNTLRGLGEGSGQIGHHHAPASPQVEIYCPACAVKADKVSPDLAACAALALLSVKGIDTIRPLLCTMHSRLFRLLMVEVEQGPKNLGTDGSSWED